MKLSYEKFKNLSEEEKKIVISLGIEIEKQKRNIEVKTKLKGYCFEVRTKCLLCGSVETENFEMFPLGSCLYSKKVTEFDSIEKRDEAELNSRTETTKTCASCKSFLEKKSKEELINMILKLAFHKPSYEKL